MESSGVTKGPKSTRAPRRPAKFWAPLNNWWRSYLTEKDKRPDTSEVQVWYNENASLIWQENEMPDWKETRIHAKCLRSTEQVKHYFRDYRARRQGNAACNELEDLGNSPRKDGSSSSPRRSCLRVVKVEPRQQDDNSLGYSIDSHNAHFALPSSYFSTTNSGIPTSPGLQRLDSGEVFFPNQQARSPPFRLSSSTGLQLPALPASTVTSGGGGAGGRPSPAARSLPPGVAHCSTSSNMAMFQANQSRPSYQKEPELVERIRSFAAGSYSGQQASCASFMGQRPGMAGAPDMFQEAASDNKRRHTAYDSTVGSLTAGARGGLAHAHSLPLYKAGVYPPQGVWEEYEAGMREAASVRGTGNSSRMSAEAGPSRNSASLRAAGTAFPLLNTSHYQTGTVLGTPAYATAASGSNVAASSGWPPATRGGTESLSLWSVAENAALNASAGGLVLGGSPRSHSFSCDQGDVTQGSMRSSCATQSRLSRFSTDGPFSTGGYPVAPSHAPRGTSDNLCSEALLPMEPSQQQMWRATGGSFRLNSQQQQEQQWQQSDVSSPTSRQKKQKQQDQQSRLNQWAQQQQQEQDWRDGSLMPDEFMVQNRSHSVPFFGARVQQRQGVAAGSRMAPHQLLHDPLSPRSGGPRPGAARAPPTQVAQREYCWMQPRQQQQQQQQGWRAGAAGSPGYSCTPATSSPSEAENEGEYEDGWMPELERLRVNSTGLVSPAARDAMLMEAERRQWARQEEQEQQQQQQQQQAPEDQASLEWVQLMQLKREVAGEDDDLVWLPHHHDDPVTPPQQQMAPAYQVPLASDSRPSSGTSAGCHSPFGSGHQVDYYAMRDLPRPSDGVPTYELPPITRTRATPAPLLVGGAAGMEAELGLQALLSPGDVSMMLRGAGTAGGGMEWERQEDGGLGRVPSWLLGMLEPERAVGFEGVAPTP